MGYEWHRVACEAVYEEGAVDAAVAEVLSRHKVGIASPTAALEFLGSCTERRFEANIGKDDIACGYGYPLEIDHFRFKKDHRVRIWAPRTEAECQDILGSLSDIDPNIYSREWIADALLRNFYSPFKTIYAVGNPSSNSARGLLVLHRELDFDDDCATIFYHMKVFHCEGSVHHRAALMTTLFYQTLADIECAVLSMHSAGLTPDFDVHVTVDDDDDGMYSSYVEQVELARDESFSHTAVPEGLDFEAYGPWITGGRPRGCDEPHVVLRDNPVRTC